MLSDTTIRKYLKSKKLIIVPEPGPDDFKSVGIKLHLGDEVLVPVTGQRIDLANPRVPRYASKKLSSRGLVLKPGGFLLAPTREGYRLPKNLVGMLDGRSSLARLGLIIHGTSQMVEGDSAEPHVITLEIKNLGPFELVLHAGMQIGMLCFFEMREPTSGKVRFNYAHQTTALPPDPKALRQT